MNHTSLSKSSACSTYIVIALFAIFQGFILGIYTEHLLQNIWDSSAPYFYLPLLFAIFLPTALSYLAINIKSLPLYKMVSVIILLILWIFLWQTANIAPDSSNEPILMIPTLIVLIFFLLPWLQSYTKNKTFKIAYADIIRSYIQNILFGAISAIISGLLIALTLLASYLFKLINLSLLSEILSHTLILWLIFTLGLNIALYFLRRNFEIEVNRICSYVARLFLPLLNIISLIFLIGLIFTNNIEINSGIILGLTAASIILINLVYEDGCQQYQFPKGLNAFILINILLLNAFSILSIYGITTRIAQYSFSIGRLYALTLALFFTFLILTYSFSIIRHKNYWMRSLGRMNSYFLLLIPCIILLINSPLLNFNKISANSILKGVEKGEIPIDYELKYTLNHLGKHGYEALKIIEENPAFQSLKEIEAMSEPIKKPITPLPQDTFKIANHSNSIPQSWWESQNDNYYCTTASNAHQCLVFTQDMNTDGIDDIVSCFIRRGDYPWIRCKIWQENKNQWQEIEGQSFSFDTILERDQAWDKLLNKEIEVRRKEWLDLYIAP